MANANGIEQGSDSLLAQRAKEKRKWQIAFRRYVLERNPSVYYAPYFGLDMDMLRKWFELQFIRDLDWDNFGSLWQFEHVVPVAYFNFEDESDLRLCWNFTNLRAESIQKSDLRSVRSDLLSAKSYFEALYESTQYAVCRLMLDKIQKIETAASQKPVHQQTFIQSNAAYLKAVETFSSYEFELLNSGRPLQEVIQEAAIVRRFK